MNFRISFRRLSLLSSHFPTLYRKPFSIIPFPRVIKRDMASSMSKRLEGKTIVITGASSGIGKSTG